jgi:hypothetical protein
MMHTGTASHVRKTGHENNLLLSSHVLITVLLNQNVLYSRICTKCTENICHQMYHQTRRTHTKKFMSLTQLRLTSMCLLWFVIMMHGPQHRFDSQQKSR